MIFLTVPTVENPTGKHPPEAALQRLERLANSLKAFPERRLVPDPFVRREGPIEILFKAPAHARPDPIIGTSAHDATVRLAARFSTDFKY